MNQVDLRIGKIINLLRSARLSANVDLFNTFNSSTVLIQNNNFSTTTTWQQIMPGRLIKLSATRLLRERRLSIAAAPLAAACTRLRTSAIGCVAPNAFSHSSRALPARRSPCGTKSAPQAAPRALWRVSGGTTRLGDGGASSTCIVREVNTKVRVNASL